jgi:hypothetical protein
MNKSCKHQRGVDGACHGKSAGEEGNGLHDYACLMGSIKVWFKNCLCGMAHRLPSYPGDGDPHEATDQDREREIVKERRNQTTPTIPSTNTHHSIPTRSTATADFIPTEARRKLKELILNSKDPRKSLDLLRARIIGSLFGPSKPAVARSPNFIAPLHLQSDSVQPGCVVAESKEEVPRAGSEIEGEFNADCTQIGEIHGAFNAMEELPAQPQVFSVYSFPLNNNVQLDEDYLVGEASNDVSEAEIVFLPLCCMNSRWASIARSFKGSNHRIKVRKKVSINPIRWHQPRYQKQVQSPHILKRSMADPAKQTTITTTQAPANTVGHLLPMISTTKAMDQDNQGVGSNAAASVADTEVVAPRKRQGKELLLELGTEEEIRAIVINMSEARGAARRRFLAVGIFLSTLLMTSKQLTDYMKKVWKIHGHLDSNQLADRRFVLEFSEEGDFTHVTKGG